MSFGYTPYLIAADRHCMLPRTTTNNQLTKVFFVFLLLFQNCQKKNRDRDIIKYIHTTKSTEISAHFY